jgi:glycosyltransferase involved in cell wall biosynthesis
MCTFNGQRFLGEQLESIAAQTRPPDELVVCDDASSDGSEQIIRDFARRVTFPVRTALNKRSLGSTKNFEKAISLCTGELVVLADQDDIWYPHKLTRIEGKFRRSPDALAVFSDADLIDEHSTPLGMRLWDSVDFNRREQRAFNRGRALDVLVKHPVVTGAAMAFRMDLVPLMTPIAQGYVHDHWISLLLAARGEIRPIAEPLMQYRRHSAQQLGPGPLDFRTRLAQSVLVGADSYHNQMKLWDELHRALSDRRKNLPNADYAMNLINGKIAHLRHRMRLPPTRIARIPSILWQGISGNYWRYAMGWKSIAKDLMVNIRGTHPSAS